MAQSPCGSAARQGWRVTRKALDAPNVSRYACGMDIRPITDSYAVSPQIAPADMAAIHAAGYRTVLCNRPDAEIPPDLGAAVMAVAARAAGLTFEVLPITHPTIEDCVAPQMAILARASGPVLAYCASGTRCSVVWSLGQAGRMPTDEILAATSRAGYDLTALRARLDEGLARPLPR